MAFVADGVDFVCGLAAPRQQGCASRAEAPIKIVYAFFAMAWFVVVGRFSDAHFSLVMTAGAVFQCLGFVLLAVQVHVRASVDGLSAKSMALFALFYGFRLMSTTLRDGYIPLDKSGDFAMQAFEFTSLVCVCYILYCFHRKFRHTYMDEYDTLELGPLVVPCVVLGIFVHGDFNNDEFFDAVWATSLNLETLTLVPQLYMMMKIGGKVDTVTAHFVATLCFAVVCRFTFWWYAYSEQEYVAGIHIITCHFLQIVLIADYMFYYAKAMINGTSLSLPTEGVDM